MSSIITQIRFKLLNLKKLLPAAALPMGIKPKSAKFEFAALETCSNAQIVTLDNSRGERLFGLSDI
jgi:hypothetical protein